MTMSAPALISAYVAVLLGALVGLSIYYELRRKQFEPRPSADRIFRCKKCAFVYTDDPDVDLSRCPHCGRMNEAIEF
jgi:hypothetical protein